MCNLVKREIVFMFWASQLLIKQWSGCAFFLVADLALVWYCVLVQRPSTSLILCTKDKRPDNPILPKVILSSLLRGAEGKSTSKWFFARCFAFCKIGTSFTIDSPFLSFDLCCRGFIVWLYIVLTSLLQQRYIKGVVQTPKISAGEYFDNLTFCHFESGLKNSQN